MQVQIAEGQTALQEEIARGQKAVQQEVAEGQKRLLGLAGQLQAAEAALQHLQQEFSAEQVSLCVSASNSFQSDSKELGCFKAVRAVMVSCLQPYKLLNDALCNRDTTTKVSKTVCLHCKFYP